MNTTLKSFLTGLLLTTQAFATEPSNGWYAGGFVGLSYAPSINFTILNPFTAGRVPGEIKHDPLVNGGLNLGYRCLNFRFEGELLYNQNQFDKISINRSRIPRLTNERNNLAFKGNTQIYAGMFNIYYDIFYEDSDSNFIPYIGVGIGYGEVRNQIKFYFNQVEFINDKVNDSLLMGQAILGLNYLINDDWTLGIDLRYTSSEKIELYNNRAAFGAVNLVLNYTFDEP